MNSAYDEGFLKVREGFERGQEAGELYNSVLPRVQKKYGARKKKTLNGQQVKYSLTSHLQKKVGAGGLRELEGLGSAALPY